MHHQQLRLPPAQCQLAVMQCQNGRAASWKRQADADKGIALQQVTALDTTTLKMN